MIYYKQILSDLHLFVKKNFVYMSDKNIHNKEEYWAKAEEQLGIVEGGKVQFVDDCDGFAFICWRLLRSMGLKSRVVLCKVNGVNGLHLVCECFGYVFDNRYDRLMMKQELDYEWIAISDYEPNRIGGVWYDLRKKG